MKLRKKLVWILCVLLLLSLSSCGAKMDIDMAPGDTMTDDYISKEEISTDADNSSSLPENRKLIQTVNMDVETENLDTVLAQLDSRIAELGGYIENSHVRNGSAYNGRRYRSADITIRIPAKDLNAFIDKVTAISNIVSSNKTVEDVTLSYIATESRMKALQTEESRLLELLAKAETLDDLLTIEQRLTDVRTELEQVTSALRVFDNQVDYATVHLDVSEVKEYTEITEPKTVWQRIGVGFKESLQGVGGFLEDLFVFLVVSVPYLVLIAVIPVGIVLIIWLSGRKKRKMRMQEQEQKKNS